ncbi:hypothetical protein ASC77_04365 [Nocardioides sp. Root1257]|uniref:hypothetical protein n=1 Tax=unclassified Nocardioides TaxID=2615069 RepID=UPI0006FE6C2A|nr:MULTISPECIES: hypothetical protein [unclassified Nocardioides]KQW53519.1 hypothetical protein ASC77_04365 [Nocardioides sp. Root1257]KRC56205.1 hypothetical protein ASE24_04365 [Nocardioides sp. Root224]
MGAAVVVGGLLVGVSAYAAGLGAADQHRTGNQLVRDWSARTDGQQVLGGSRTPGVPSVQRLRHDDVTFTVTVAPARPGPNLVRVDSTHQHGRTGPPVLVGTGEDDLVRARPRPGTDGLWAVVDLPEGSGTVLVTHGPTHRLPFIVETGTDPVDTADWVGADGPECVAVATAAVLAAGPAPTGCPAAGLTARDADSLRGVVSTLVDRGVEEIAVEHDESARSIAAYDLVRGLAGESGVPVVRPDDAPGDRNALVVLGGWETAAHDLTAVSSRPLRQQPIRSDGTWLAPWLLSPGVVDSTAGAMLALDFDIRDQGAQEFSQTLGTYFPGQLPTGPAYLAWRSVRGDAPRPLGLYAASRAAYMPASSGHAGHETVVSWFPGGTVTPVGSLGAS